MATLSLLFIYLYIFILAAPGLHCCAGVGEGSTVVNDYSKASHYDGLSCCTTQTLKPDSGMQLVGSGTPGSITVALGLRCSAACRNLLRSGVKPISPGLADWTLNHWPPGKSCCLTRLKFCLPVLGARDGSGLRKAATSTPDIPSQLSTPITREVACPQPCTLTCLLAKAGGQY